MKLGSKGRLKEFNLNREDAEAVGHAMFATSPELQRRLCGDILNGIEEESQMRKSKALFTDVQDRTSRDLLRLTHRREIDVDEKWSGPREAVVAADARAADGLRASAEKARLKKERQRAFERWEAEQNAGTGAQPAKSSVVSKAAKGDIDEED